MKFPKSIGAFLSLVLVMVLFCCAFTCTKPASGTQAFYQGLVTTHTALTTIAANPTSVVAVQYKTQINQAIASQNAADASFMTFYANQSGDSTVLVANIATVSSDVVALVADFTAPLSPAKAAKMRAKFSAAKMKASASGASVTFQDILPILQIALGVAQGFIPPQYGPLAQVALQVLQSAIAANTSAATSIDLTVLTPIAKIP